MSNKNRKGRLKKELVNKKQTVIYYVTCEGETEELFFKKCRDIFKLKNIKIEIQSAGGENKLDTCPKYNEYLKKKKLKQKDVKHCYVHDVDGNKKKENRELRDKKAEIYKSNPSFELVLLLGKVKMYDNQYNNFESIFNKHFNEKKPYKNIISKFKKDDIDNICKHPNISYKNHELLGTDVVKLIKTVFYEK